MSEIILSSAVRANVATLRNTSQLMAAMQTRLATGKRVNSALDNPATFLHAAQMLRRAAELESAVDRIATAQKTLEAAQESLSALNSLVTSA
jgi:flagellin